MASLLGACAGPSSESDVAPPTPEVAIDPDPVIEQPKLVSLTPDAAVTGGQVFFVAELENTQLFRMWATKNGQRVAELCNISSTEPQSRFNCTHSLSIDQGMYDLEIILNSSDAVGAESPDTLVTGYRFGVSAPAPRPDTTDNCSMPAPAGHSLYWCDDFAATSTGAPDSNFWDYDVSGVRNNEEQCYTDNDRENVRVEDRELLGEAGNYLVLELRKEEGTTCPQDPSRAYNYTSGAIMTRVRQNGDYLVGRSLENQPSKGMPFGVYEIRAKIPSGRGTWPAIWMLGHVNWDAPGGSLGWPEAGEIDIMEAVGFEEHNGLFRTHHTLHRSRDFQWPHLRQTANGRNVTGLGMTYAMDEAPSADFKVYKMIWQPDSIELFVDGESTMQMQVADNNGGMAYQTRNAFYRHDVSDHGLGMQAETPLGWPFSKELGNEFKLILNLAHGGGWGGQQGLDDSIFDAPVEMLVDYVRVYTPDPG
ncbi:MAG: family 16 glycosylhydrolase [Gammaproteobacteria bacterium]